MIEWGPSQEYVIFIKTLPAISGTTNQAMIVVVFINTNDYINVISLIKWYKIHSTNQTYFHNLPFSSFLFYFRFLMPFKKYFIFQILKKKSVALHECSAIFFRRKFFFFENGPSGSLHKILDWTLILYEAVVPSQNFYLSFLSLQWVLKMTIMSNVELTVKGKFKETKLTQLQWPNNEAYWFVILLSANPPWAYFTFHA